MGYDLHITRKVYWFETEQDADNISLDEWLLYIHIDASELELVDTHGVKVAREDARLQQPPGFCEWTTHPQNERPWFYYSDGNISTKNPDEPTIIKMISMAKDLHAKVQGDDGEVYELSATNEIISRHTGPRLEDETKNVKEKPWWKFW